MNSPVRLHEPLEKFPNIRRFADGTRKNQVCLRISGEIPGVASYQPYARGKSSGARPYPEGDLIFFNRGPHDCVTKE